MALTKPTTGDRVTIPLGDFYNFVKRFWSENLHAIALLYAHPKFVSVQICGPYMAATSIPILVLESAPKGSFGILFDLDRGILFPHLVATYNGLTCHITPRGTSV